MKTRLLLIICLACSLLIPANPIQGLPGFLICKYESDYTISANKLEFVPDETFVFNVKTAQGDDSFEVVMIDPKGKKVFSDVLVAEPGNYSQTRFHIPDDSQKGTWSVFVNANPSGQQEAIFFGVDEPPQHILAVKPSAVNYKYKVDDASFLIAGEPDTDVQINIIEPSGDKKHIYIATILPEGKCIFSLDLEEYAIGVYGVEITDYVNDASAVFAVGLEPSRGVIAIRTSADSYFAGDMVSVLGDTAPGVSLSVDVIDPSENVVDRFFVVSGKTGIINASFRLPADANNGTWMVKATSSPNFDSVEFDVSQRLQDKIENNAMSASFDINGYTVTTNSSNISEINLNWGNGVLPSGLIVFDKVIDDRIYLQIPKEMPRTVNLDFGVGLYAIQSPTHAELPIEQTESDCFYNLSIPVRNSDKIEITSASPAAGRVATMAVNDCSETEIIKLPLKVQIENNVHVKQIECKNESHLLVERPGGKLACVYHSTAEKLGWDLI